MQLLMRGGSSKTLRLDATGTEVPLTQPVLAAGATSITAQLFVPSDVSNTVVAELVYRWLPTDEPTDAGPWQATGATQTGPGKSRASHTLTSVDGLMIQLGIKLSSNSPTEYGRASLEYPIVVVG